MSGWLSGGQHEEFRCCKDLCLCTSLVAFCAQFLFWQLTACSFRWIGTTYLSLAHTAVLHAFLSLSSLQLMLKVKLLVAVL